MAEGWSFLLADSANMDLIGVLSRASGRTLSTDNNKSGSAGCSIRMSHRYASAVRPWKTAIVAQHDDDWFWSGPVQSISRDFAAGRMTINAVGWFEYLVHRVLEEKKVYNAQNDNDIAHALLALANARFQSPITQGLSIDGQLRNRTYEIDANFGTEIQGLGELEAGYDWYVDPVTRQLHIVQRRGFVNEDCKWIFIADGKANKSNCLNVVEDEDGSVLVNDSIVRGKFGFARAQGFESQAEYGLFQEVTSLSEVTDSNILNAYANAEIVYKSQPKLTYSITPKSELAAGVPKLFRDFNIGDTGFLTAKRDGFEIEDQAVRMFGADLQIDDAGAARVTRLQTSPG